MWLRVLLLVCLLLPGALLAAPVILVFGDSLSAAYGVPRESGWATLLQARLAEEKFKHQVINASISGETTAGGLRRIDAALATHRPAIVILQLGANDGLRGLPLDAMASNLDAMVRVCIRRDARVLIIGMRLPPNYGMRYTQKFQESYAVLAKRHKLALVPFMLEGLQDNRLFQADGLHPGIEAQPRIMENVWAALKPMLKHKGR